MTSIRGALTAWTATLVLIALAYGYAEFLSPFSRGDTPDPNSVNEVADLSTEDQTDTAQGESGLAGGVNDPDGEAEERRLRDLPAAPGPHMVEDNLETARQGNLPKISGSGVRPFDAYRTPGPTDTSVPRVAIVISELGMRSRTTQRVIDQAPHNVTLAFSPYGTRLSEWAETARGRGHELLMMIPMEPVNYPQQDPGPLALLVGQTERTNLDLLRSSLATMTGYVGIITHMGSRFTASVGKIDPIINELGARGLMIVDNRDSRQSRAAEIARSRSIPTALNDNYIDREPRAEAIALRLSDLENRARREGAALGVGRAFPVTISAINEWAAGLTERGVLLVPDSHLADLQPLPR